MSRKLIEDVTRVHLMLFQRDIDRIDSYFANPISAGTHKRSRSEAIRLILTKFLDQVDAKAQQNFQPARGSADVAD